MQLNENDLSYFIDIVDCIIDINEFTNAIEYYQKEFIAGIIKRIRKY
jgi:hypothetical protein